MKFKCEVQMCNCTYYIAREGANGSQEKEEEGQEEEERIRSSGLPDSHLLRPRSSDSQGRAYNQAPLNGST
jgi:hypothetical protein